MPPWFYTKQNNKIIQVANSVYCWIINPCYWGGKNTGNGRLRGLLICILKWLSSKLSYFSVFSFIAVLHIFQMFHLILQYIVRVFFTVTHSLSVFFHSAFVFLKSCFIVCIYSSNQQELRKEKGTNISWYLFI